MFDVRSVEGRNGPRMGKTEFSSSGPSARTSCSRLRGGPDGTTVPASRRSTRASCASATPRRVALGPPCASARRGTPCGRVRRA
ncbi:hypothetical protein SAMN05216278_1065 [Halopelagius longus]|uniref:Uncharacterized protein n=1 Tax=Halopelagius longus TaxID=1236180 RepID=A0A1H0Z7L4_9EURY|nr:hypothetical protein SAMN05216278_1065 [Halopelagius longus]